MHDFRIRRQVEFADTDMSGIVHFARFFVFMEAAEHQFLTALGGGAGAYLEEGGSTIGWPRVAASCQYLRPARFGDLLEIELRVLRKGRTSLTFAFDLRRGEELIAQGQVTTVCCHLGGGAGIQPVPIPAALASRIAEAPQGMSGGS